MKVIEIAFTGYVVTDTKRARAFYEGVLGLKESRVFGDGVRFEWIEYDIGPHTLAVIKSDGKDWLPAPNGTAAALEVDDIDGFEAKLRKSGATIVFEKSESPMCFSLIAADPDGNRIGIHQRKPGNR